MRHHHQTPNRFSPLSSLCLLILLSESCHNAASSSLDESKVREAERERKEEGEGGRDIINI